MYQGWSEIAQALSLYCYKFVGRNLSSSAISVNVSLSLLKREREMMLKTTLSQDITVPFAEPYSLLPWQLLCLDICLALAPSADYFGGSQSLKGVPHCPSAPSTFLMPTQEFQQQQNTKSSNCSFRNQEQERLAVFSSGMELQKITVEEQFPMKASLPISDAIHHWRTRLICLHTQPSNPFSCSSDIVEAVMKGYSPVKVCRRR